MRIAELQRNFAKKSASPTAAPCNDVYNVVRHPVWLLQAIQTVIRQYPLKMFGQTPMAFASRFVMRLSQTMQAGPVTPLPVTRAVPPLRDRVIREALWMLWHPIFRGFCDKSDEITQRVCYRTCDAHQAVCHALLAQPLWWAVGVEVIDVLSKSTWRTVLRMLVDDRRLLDLTQAFLIEATLEEAMMHAGMTVYLRPIDAWVSERQIVTGPVLRCVRTGSQVVLLTNGSKAYAVELKAAFQEFLVALGLHQSAKMVWQQHVTDGFTFAGCHFLQSQVIGAGASLQVQLDKARVQEFKRKIYAMTDKSTAGDDPAEKIRALNAVIRTWGHTYRGNMGRTVSSHLGRFVHERMYRWLRAKHSNVTARVSAEKFVASSYLRPRQGQQVWSSKGVSLLSFEKIREYAR